MRRGGEGNYYRGLTPHSVAGDPYLTYRSRRMRIRSFFHCCKPGLPSFLALAVLAASHSQGIEHQLFTATSALLGGVNSKNPSIYKEGWIDFNKDGTENVFEDPAQPVEKRVEDLLGRMNRQEKMGQLWQGPEQASNAQMDLVAQGGLGTYPCLPGCELRNTLQRAAVEDSRLGIPLLFGFGAESATIPSAIQPVGLRNGGRISDQDLDDKVRLILKRKFAAGLFEQPYTKEKPVEAPLGKGV